MSDDHAGLPPRPLDAERNVFQKAVALHRAGRLEDAISHYRRAAAVAPHNHGILCNLGIALKQCGQINQAIEIYRRALALAPDFTDAHYNLGIALEIAGRNHEAEKAYRRAIGLRPAFPAALSNLGNTLKRQGRFSEAEDSYRAADAQRPDHPGTLVNLAETMGELGRHGEAIEVCRRVIAIHPTYLAAYCWLSRAQSALGQYDEAVDTAKKALDLDPRHQPALACLASATRGRGDLETTVAACHGVIERHPEMAHAHCLLADLQLELGEAETALATSEAYLAQDPAHIEALALKTTALTNLGRETELASLADQDRLIRAKPWQQVPDYPDLATFNRALARHVRDHPTLRHDPAGTATREGRHSGELLIEPKGPIAQLEKMICSAVEDYGKALLPNAGHPFLAKPPQAWILTIWAVVLEKQGYQISHIHPSGWLSGVYYVELPDLIGNEGTGREGWIEFGRPYQRHETRTEPPVRLYQPKEGLMLLFPSYFHHRTLPFESHQTRISIAFDVMPR